VFFIGDKKITCQVRFLIENMFFDGIEREEMHSVCYASGFI